VTSSPRCRRRNSDTALVYNLLRDTPRRRASFSAASNNSLGTDIAVFTFLRYNPGHTLSRIHSVERTLNLRVHVHLAVARSKLFGHRVRNVEVQLWHGDTLRIGRKYVPYMILCSGALGCQFQNCFPVFLGHSNVELSRAPLRVGWSVLLDEMIGYSAIS